MAGLEVDRETVQPRLAELLRAVETLAVSRPSVREAAVDFPSKMSENCNRKSARNPNCNNHPTDKEVSNCHVDS